MCRASIIPELADALLPSDIPEDEQTAQLIEERFPQAYAVAARREDDYEIKLREKLIMAVEHRHDGFQVE